MQRSYVVEGDKSWGKQLKLGEKLRRLYKTFFLEGQERTLRISPAVFEAIPSSSRALWKRRPARLCLALPSAHLNDVTLRAYATHFRRTGPNSDETFECERTRLELSERAKTERKKDFSSFFSHFRRSDSRATSREFLSSPFFPIVSFIRSEKRGRNTLRIGRISTSAIIMKIKNILNLSNRGNNNNTVHRGELQ